MILPKLYQVDGCFRIKHFELNKRQASQFTRSRLDALEINRNLEPRLRHFDGVGADKLDNGGRAVLRCRVTMGCRTFQQLSNQR
jgi:hypothetical protein